MAITGTELKLYRAATNDDTTLNGGTMSAVESVTGVSGNILPDVDENIRTNGTTAVLTQPRYRKVFFKNTNIEAGPLSLTNSRIYMSKFTNGLDWVNFFPAAAFLDVQSAIAGTEARYGVCDLATSIAAGVIATVEVTLEDSSNNDIFNNGDTIRLYDSVSTNEEFIVVTTAAAPVGTAQTLTCAGNVVNAYTNTDTIVSTVYSHGTVQATATIPAATGPGTGVLSSVNLNNIGCVEDVWTFVFNTDTTFTVTGNVTGTPAGNSGNISTTFTLNNPDFPGYPYLEITAAQWGANWLNTDQQDVSTFAAAIPFWVSQEVPAGAAAITSNTFKMIIDGETV